MLIESIKFRNNRGKDLAGRIYKPESENGVGVVFSHGLFSNKDGYKITRLAADIVSTGCTLMTFDFSFAGASGVTIADLSVLQEADDLACAVARFKEYGVDTIHLMGSSMGAAVTLLYASRTIEKIASLILIAVPVDMRTLFAANTGITDIESLPYEGATMIENIPVKNAFFHEINKIDLTESIRTIDAPVLVIHGARDQVVDIGNVSLLEENLSAELKKIIISDGDHSLTRDSDLEIIRKGITSWLREKY